MSKHEIRLRRQKLTAHGVERFRNYGSILERHDHDLKIKRIVKAFSFFLVILIFIMLIVIVVRMEKKANKKSDNPEIKTQSESVQIRKNDHVFRVDKI